jgi:NAD(P)-dependent dehydrogenase (short-subunit alcohol dehydrogenase family)
MTLSQQVALVTGAGRGIGREVSLALARQGAAVGLVARTPSELAETAALIEQVGGRARPHQADVTDRAAVARAMADIEAALGPIDLLVNNAGSNKATGRFQDVDPELWWRDIEINLKSAYLCSHAVVPGMIERGRGRIVNVASQLGIVPMPNSSAYSTSKAALLRLTDALASDLADSGIRVFAISPGMVRTQLVDEIEAKLREGDPDFAGVPDAAFQPIEAGAALVVEIAAGRADRLNGRYIHVSENLDAMLERSEEIERDDLYTLRMKS